MPEDVVDVALQAFERHVLQGPEAHGRELAREQTEHEIALIDVRDADASTLLAKLDQGGVGPIPELVGDAAAFPALFPVSNGAARDGTADLQHPDAAVLEGTVLVFPAGVFQVRNLMQEKRTFPRGVTIRGAGMDLTLLLMEAHAHQAVENVAFEDCTLLSNCDLLEGAAISARLDRVRVIGFDCGAGGSTAFGPRRLALLARHSRFEGGYGRHPAGGGGLFDVRSDALAARFENCWLDQVELRPRRLHSGATVVFAGCRLTNVLDRGELERSSHPGLVFTSSSLEFLPDEETPPARDLNVLFPDWEARLER